jgi:hypothetical protein
VTANPGRLEINQEVTKGRSNMRQTTSTTAKVSKYALSGLLLAGALFLGTTPAFSQRTKAETIDASSMGTGTQLGQMFEITITINEFSSPADKQILMEAFQKGQNQGLVNALTKMKAVGHIAITGTLGYDLSYIKMIPTPAGRKIRFATNRQIRFGEAFFDTQSQSFNLTAGEIDIDDSDKSKSTGVLYPAAQLIIDKQGQMQLDLNQNAWKLVDVLDWKGTAGVN